ncbi:hypothetical protein F4810DRAFT_227144 [Camillea tinctor]|nr:hypothetical protein F4810DRAFT_227144 [Camillea tinctor]
MFSFSTARRSPVGHDTMSNSNYSPHATKCSMNPHGSPSHNNTTMEPSRSDQPAGRAVTIFNGRYIHTSKLESLLIGKFGNDFGVELRQNVYKVTARSELSRDDIKKCY